MRAGPATAVFLLAVAGVSFTYACWVRGTLVERTRQCIQLRAADEGNREAIAHLQAEVARRDTIIASRDLRIRSIEKESTELSRKLEVLYARSDVSEWADRPVPPDVLRLLQDGDRNRFCAREDTSAGGSHAAD